MHIIATEYQRRHKNTREDDNTEHGNTRTLQDGIQLKGRGEVKKKFYGNKRYYVLQDQINSSKQERHAYESGRNNHQASDWE